MSRGEEIWGHFYSADVNRDQGLDSDELQDYLNRNKTISGRNHVENDKMRYGRNLKFVSYFLYVAIVQTAVPESSDRGG